MTAVQFSEDMAVLAAVAPTGVDGGVATVRRRLHLRRVRGAHQVSARQRGRAASSFAEAEDHWDDGARAQLAMVGISYRTA